MDIEVIDGCAGDCVAVLIMMLIVMLEVVERLACYASKPQTA